MQLCAFVGKIYSKKYTDGKNPRLAFRLAVRKSYVSEDDRENGRVNEFVPCVAFGPLAERINEFFAEGDPICIHAEYQTFTYTDDDGDEQRSHNFKVNSFFFPPTNGNGNGKRDRDEDEDRKIKKKKKLKKAKKRYEEEDDDFDWEEDDDDVPF